MYQKREKNLYIIKYSGSGTGGAVEGGDGIRKESLINTVGPYSKHS